MGRYDTTLSAADETEFTMWFNQQKREGKIQSDDIGQDYDFRGYWADIASKGQDATANSHFPDTYKKPNHPTFSTESKYATGENLMYAGVWNGDKFQPSILKYIPSIIDMIEGVR